MNCFDHDSTGYAVVFSFITGASASFIVAIVVELTNNYRHNKLAWYELQEYYSAVYDFELHKRFLMNNTPVQRDDSFSNMGSDNKVDDLSKDIVEVTWEQIPELIPVFKETLEKKKSYLADKEINELNDIVCFCYKTIHSVICSIYMKSPLYTLINNSRNDAFIDRPFEDINNTTDWFCKRIYGNIDKKAIDRVVDEILSDNDLLSQFMKEYDISQRSIDNYKDSVDTDEMDVQFEANSKKTIEGYEDFSNANNQDIPYESYIISCMCKDIAKSIDELEKEILKKPYYGNMLVFCRNYSDTIISLMNTEKK